MTTSLKLPISFALATLVGCNAVPEGEGDDPLPESGDVVAAGELMDRVHPTSGRVEVIEDVDAETASLVLTDLLSDDGPALFVYLATDETATDFIDLGPLGATSGTLTYEIPGGSYDADYDHVLIWCERFSILFGSATLDPASS